MHELKLLIVFICYFIGAVIQISKNLACEWARDKIRTNTVAPWAVNTGAKVENVNNIRN